MEFVSCKNYVKHSFKILIYWPKYFDLHFNHKFKKEKGSNNTLKSLPRSITSKVATIACEAPLKKNALIVVSSEYFRPFTFGTKKSFKYFLYFAKLFIAM